MKKLSLLLFAAMMALFVSPKAQVATTPQGHDNAAAAPAVRQKADEASVDEVVARLVAKRTDEERRTVARVFVRRLNMGTDQVVRFAKTFKSEEEALSFLRYAHAYVIDPQHYHKAADAFTTEANRNKFLSLYPQPK
ncbi:MAG: DUF4476 domain-containing protein [Bacteroidales bacterium]|nr:DUF4476 domain-containing protein [Bacteroidales bacterium]